jgi:hypothetical protein
VIHQRRAGHLACVAVVSFGVGCGGGEKSSGSRPSSSGVSRVTQQRDCVASWNSALADGHDPTAATAPIGPHAGTSDVFVAVYTGSDISLGGLGGNSPALAAGDCVVFSDAQGGISQAITVGAGAVWSAAVNTSGVPAPLPNGTGDPNAAVTLPLGLQPPFTLTLSSPDGLTVTASELAPFIAQ